MLADMVAGIAAAAAGQQAAPAPMTKPNRLVSASLAAVSELCLIAILLVDAVLSYAATRFARACRLQPPCLFCSRLDHVLGGERRGFHRHSLCHSHKIEVSSLIYCHAHRRLASCRNMCEPCLLSSAAPAPRKPKLPVSNAAETEHLGDVTLLYGGGDLGQASVGSCSCCGEPFAFRRDVLQSKKKKVVKVDGAGVNGAQAGRRAQLRKKQGKNSELPWTHAFDLMSHVGYSELKITSESEKEMPFDDKEDDGYDENEDGYSPMHGVMDIEESCSTSAKPPVEDLLTEKLSHSNAVSSTSSSSDSETKPAAAQGLEEINWNIVDSNVKSVDSTERTIELDASCSAGLESHDAACFVADVEGETSAERLGQQVEHEQDRMTVAALYKELEEERNASAVAAKEAMAMINRLQEEKAGMRMEALQYLRMMEEQAAHDQEAIHNLNNLLTDREKELLDLEAELESCRKRLGEVPTEPEEKPSHETELKRMAEGFEEEKAQISTCLKNLQEKIDDGGCCGSLRDEVSRLKDRLHAHYAEKEILSRAVGALRYGTDGVSLVEEMACQLRELRRIPVT